MSRAMPNVESLRVSAALIEGRSANGHSLKTDGEVVSLKGSTVLRVLDRTNPDDTSNWKVEVNLCGWGDTRTTRNHINSVLCRLNLPYRVGMHNHTSYLYVINKTDSANVLSIVTQLPENGWTSLPMETL